MRRLIAIAFLGFACLGATVACAGPANADEQVVIVNNETVVSEGSVDCVPASVAAAFPWLPVTVCA